MSEATTQIEMLALEEAISFSRVNVGGVDSHAAQLQALIQYVDMIFKWNRVYNLTAIRDRQKMWTHHIYDCLPVVSILDRWIADSKTDQGGGDNITPSSAIRVLDVGSGGGMPGVILAILRPEWDVTLIDPVHKKTAFLNQVKVQLQLQNLHVITGKVESMSGQPFFDVVTSRAFASLADFVTLSAAAVGANGFFAAMKSLRINEEQIEFEARCPDWQVVATEDLAVFNMDDAFRQLVQVKRRFK